MVRYNPIENGHCEYEVKPAKSETKEKSTKKKKRDKSVPEVKEPAPPEPEVSKDIYYAVSDTLIESLKQKGEFSLLKAHGKERDDTGVYLKEILHLYLLLYHISTWFLESFIFSENVKDNDAFTVENNTAQKFKFHFNAKNNPFKYDSSDNEDTHEAPDIDNQMVDESKEETMQQNNLFGYKDTLFFDSNDARFNGMYIRNS